MAADSLFSNELLCYLMHKYGNSPVDSLKAVIVAFYTPTEITIAKNTIYKAAESIEDSLPRPIQRRKSDDKPRLDTDDILTLMDALDERALLTALPKYVASDLSRVPPVNTGDLDVTLLMLRVAALESKVSHVVDECVEAARATLNDGLGTTSQPHQTSAAAAATTATASPPAAEVPSWSTAETDDADGAVQQSSDGVEWTKIVKKKATHKSPAPPKILHRFSGKHAASATASSQVKTVPRKINAFVSRLHTDTTEDELVAYFNDIGILDVKCSKIKPPEGSTFKTSAFKVTADAKYADKFYDENNWPDGCDVRDWYVRKSRPITTQT